MAYAKAKERRTGISGAEGTRLLLSAKMKGASTTLLAVFSTLLFALGYEKLRLSGKGPLHGIKVGLRTQFAGAPQRDGHFPSENLGQRLRDIPMLRGQ